MTHTPSSPARQFCDRCMIEELNPHNRECPVCKRPYRTGDVPADQTSPSRLSKEAREEIRKRINDFREAPNEAGIDWIIVGADELESMLDDLEAQEAEMERMREAMGKAADLYDNRLGHRPDNPLWSAPQYFWQEFGTALESLRPFLSPKP